MALWNKLLQEGLLPLSGYFKRLNEMQCVHVVLFTMGDKYAVWSATETRPTAECNQWQYEYEKVAR